MKYYLLVLLIVNTNFLFGQDNRPFSIGLRTGAIHDVYTYTPKHNIGDQYRNVRNGFNHQAFLNYEFGKNKSWILETNVGYYGYSREDWDSFFDGFGDLHYGYNYRKTNVYGLNLEFRYCFFNLKQMNWKHYIGATVALNRYITKTEGFDNFHNINVYDRRSLTYKFWYNYTGIQYYSKLNLPKRFSVQYLIGYSFSSTQFAPEGENGIVGEPRTNRINVNFGLGYQL